MKNSHDSVNQTRRSILKAVPALAISPALFAQSPSPVAVQKLHSFEIRVSDVARSLKFYQELFAAPIQARQGDTVVLRIGAGPHYFSIAPVSSGQQPGFSHIGLSVANFDADRVRDQLQAFGVERSSQPAPGQRPLNMAMRSWIKNRGSDDGGSAGGTRDLYFADIEGIVYHLSSEADCGGSGVSAERCERLEPASADGMFELVDLSHFTNFMGNRDRANAFYTRTFAKQYQAYQGPGSPVIGVGDGIQFLMFVGGSQEGTPTQPGSINHVCFSMNNFAVDQILASLTDYGLTAREDPADTQPLMHWVSMRMPDRGGAEGGTPEVYFSDPDGIRIQLQDPGYCGGTGYLGDDCSL